MGTAPEPYMYYGRLLVSARFAPDEEKSGKSQGQTPDPMLPDSKSYTAWFDIYELNSESLGRSDKYWIEIQIGDIIYPPRELVSEDDSKYFSKWSEPLQRFIWKERRYRALKDVRIFFFIINLDKRCKGYFSITRYFHQIM